LLDWYEATHVYAPDDQSWPAYIGEQYHQQQMFEELTQEWM
jgi:hypothetical protein